MPVKWTGERTEHFLGDAHGRDNVTVAEIAMDKDGKFLAMRVDLIANMGAYLSQFAPYIPEGGVTMSTGLYDIPAMSVRDVAASTPTPQPVDAYRGAGRPEAAYLVERLVEVCGRDTGLGPIEIRKRNFIRPQQLPYRTQGGRLYDSGEFAGHFDRALDRPTDAGFPARAEAAKRKGKVRGLGIATYVEACAFPGHEPATLTLNGDGTRDALIGTQTNGQGHATAYSQFIAGHLGLDYDKITVIQGDTDLVAQRRGDRRLALDPDRRGFGRSLGDPSSPSRSSRSPASSSKPDIADLEIADGAVEDRRHRPRRSRLPTWQRTPRTRRCSPRSATSSSRSRPTRTAATSSRSRSIPRPASPRSPTTLVVDDFGVTVNPILLAGQVHGGIAQGDRPGALRADRL